MAICQGPRSNGPSNGSKRAAAEVDEPPAAVDVRRSWLAAVGLNTRTSSVLGLAAHGRHLGAGHARAGARVGRGRRRRRRRRPASGRNASSTSAYGSTSPTAHARSGPRPGRSSADPRAGSGGPAGTGGTSSRPRQHPRGPQQRECQGRRRPLTTARIGGALVDDGQAAGLHEAPRRERRQGRAPWAALGVEAALDDRRTRTRRVTTVAASGRGNRARRR